MTYQKANITPYSDHTGRALTERDLLAGLTEALRGVLSADPEAPPLEGAEALQRLLTAHTERSLERTLSECEAAQWLGLKPATLANRRRRGTGPAVYAVRNGKALYTPQALHDWQSRT